MRPFRTKRPILGGTERPERPATAGRIVPANVLSRFRCSGCGRRLEHFRLLPPDRYVFVSSSHRSVFPRKWRTRHFEFDSTTNLFLLRSQSRSSESLRPDGYEVFNHQWNLWVQPASGHRVRLARHNTYNKRTSIEMSSSETPFSTADSDVGSSTPTEGVTQDQERGDGSHLQVPANSRNLSEFEDYLERSRKNWDRISKRYRIDPSAFESSSSASVHLEEDPTKPKKKVKLYEVPDGTLKVPEEFPPDPENPDEDDIIYKVENSLMTLPEAIAIQSEETAKELDLRPGVKVLSFIEPRCLGCIRWVYEAKAFVPVRIDLSFFDVQELSVLQCFPHTRILNLTGNKLRVDCMEFLKYLPNLKVLNLNNNRLYTCDLPSLKLKWVSFKKNRIVWMDPFSYPDLEYLNVDENRLKFVHYLDDEFCPNLARVSFCRNRMRTTLAQWACSIRYLFLNYCKIRKIEGMENLVNLQVFHLRGCRVKKLHGFTWHMQSLSYLNLRENKISNIRQFKRLRALPNLKVLITTGCPFDEEKPEERTRWALLYAYKKLVRINKKLVQPVELENRDLGKDDIDNDEDSSDDAIAEDSEEEEEGPPIDWDDDDDPDSANFDPKRNHVQLARFTKRSKTPIFDEMMKECAKKRTAWLKAKGYGEGNEEGESEWLSEGEGVSEGEGAEGSSEGGTTQG